MNRLWTTSILLMLVFTTLLTGKPLVSHAQEEVKVDVENPTPEYTFGEKAQFQALLQSSAPVKEVLLFVQNGPDAEVIVQPASFDSSGNIGTKFDLKKNPFHPFSTVNYWFQVNLQNGETYNSSTYSFPYIDNRFPWEMIESAPFRVHWYSGDIGFAQEILNVAQAGVRRVQQILSQALVPQAIDIYVYASGDALREAVVTSDQNWIAGHTNPELSVVTVSLPPGPEQQLEMERQIPHELMHVMMYYTDKNAYANLPAWFIEGLASMAELYPNPDYPVLLQNAYQTNSLLPLKTLCEVIPNDSHQALLAYAESASFLNFLYGEYGSDGFARLMALYAQGQDCEQAIQTGFRANLSRLENQWQRQTFTPNSIQKAFAELLPWLFLLIAILVGPFILAFNIIRHRTARAEL